MQICTHRGQCGGADIPPCLGSGGFAADMAEAETPYVQIVLASPTSEAMDVDDEIPVCSQAGAEASPPPDEEPTPVPRPDPATEPRPVPANVPAARILARI